MAPDVVRRSDRWGGDVHRVELYTNQDNSECSGEWDSFLDALDSAPTTHGAVLMRNGELLAESALLMDGELGWAVRRPR